MSRIANNPVPVPNGVEVTIDGPDLNVKGAKGALQLTLHSLVTIAREDDLLLLKAVGPTQQATALAGTFRSLISNMVQGVSEGFQKQLELQGVGYRAQSQGAKLNLTLGFFPTRLSTTCLRGSKLKRQPRRRLSSGAWISRRLVRFLQKLERFAHLSLTKVKGCDMPTNMSNVKKLRKSKP